MNQPNSKTYTAFKGEIRIGSGDITLAATLAKEAIDKDPQADIHIFDDITGELLELDFRGTVEDILRRLPASDQPDKIEARGPGRPKLGVVAREVTLLPRHWDWLNTQPGGASVALRKLVEIARRENAGHDQIRQARDAGYKFLFLMAGDRPHYEEALRPYMRAIRKASMPGSKNGLRTSRRMSRNCRRPRFRRINKSHRPRQHAAGGEDVLASAVAPRHRHFQMLA
jgi:uncharacterized protein